MVADDLLAPERTVKNDLGSRGVGCLGCSGLILHGRSAWRSVRMQCQIVRYAPGGARYQPTPPCAWRIDWECRAGRCLGYRARVHIIGLDHVQVAAPIGSESAARRFYGGLLGLGELEKPGALRNRGGVWFACGDHQLHVGVTKDFSPARKAHPALRVRLTDLDLIAERLTGAGSTVQWDDAIPGTRRFYTADPWGNRIELIGAN
jgi:catechol 2,3-dioxygenase-like lactoylglutathione lyase family enzyme